MDMILLDWTRMGRNYCLAGAVLDHSGVRIVRPLSARHRNAPVRNVGWSAWQLDGRSRWEIFELLGPEPAAAEPPHLEDLWVRALRPCRRLATVEQRRQVLAATGRRDGEPAFGAPLHTTRAGAFLHAGEGTRSLITLVLSRASIAFAASTRSGMTEPDYRAALTLPQLGERHLPVKDHHLLQMAEQQGSNREERIARLNARLRDMGESIAVRLGLSRPFQWGDAEKPAVCWLMADGFFSASDPQP
jgi:hypothetical protein